MEITTAWLGYFQLWAFVCFAVEVSSGWIERPCPDLPSRIDRGWRSRSIEGRFAEYRCMPGFVTAGSPTLSCRDGKWTSDPPKCLGRNCPRRYSLPHGTTVLSNRGSVARFSCGQGYRLQGADKLACLGQEWNGTVPTCTEMHPKTTRGDPENEEVAAPWMTEADYSCIVAKVNPPAAQNGNAIVKWAMVGGKPRLYARYVCKRGYELEERAKMYCKEGRWVGSKPYCSGDVQPAEQTAVKVNLYGDQPKPGTKSHREWMLVSDYSCARNRAVVPDVQNSHRWNRYAVIAGKARLYAQYKCMPGHKLRGEPYMYCKEREWVGNPGSRPSCVKQGRESPCDVDKGGCDQLCDESRGQATCSCSRGYQLGWDRKSCQDVDECARQNGGCEHKCFNTRGASMCGCHPGYRLAQDGKHCLKDRRRASRIPPSVLFKNG